MAELQNINQQIGSFHDSMTFFNQHFEDLKANLEEKSTHIKVLQEENLNLKNTVNDLSSRLCLVEQQMRESNIEINGIPEKNSENLSSIVNKIAKSVDCQLKDDDVLHVTRVAKLNKENPRPRTVVAKLRSTRHRDALIAAVSSYNRKNPGNKLSTNHIGYDGASSPVYVAEHLTPTYKALHAEARKKAKELSYKFIWVLDEYIPEYKLTVEVYCALTLVPLVLICQIRNLKYLVPFSAAANALLVVCFAITMYYLFSDLPSPADREMVASVTQWPLFISTVIFAMEGIGVVMPVENEMAKPQHFLGCPGVLNVAMTIVISLYGLVGFFGYIKYGDDVRGSVTLNLPQDEIPAQAAKILMAVAILFTYTLQFYVPMEMIWRQLGDKVSARYHNVTQVSIRTAAVVGSVALAAAFPDLELFISLCGAIFLSTLGLLTPAVVDSVHRWERGLGRFYWILWKNILVGVLSLTALFAGSYVSIRGIVDRFGEPALAELSGNSTGSL
ncbi:unnamed protein product [Plutella xylostella]|uniref:(diamondback moth) hypothetical protein n=1 Tax=Plutella xylostella TaxID=51655 RepID=A0A8S4G0Q1_PLUXY|nr:unnamed protein product [Plutella xylostella]